VAITAGSSSLAWSAASNAPWLTITSTPAGVGNGTLTFRVDPNASGAARTAEIRVNEAFFAVSQLAGTADVTFDPPTVQVPAAGVTRSVGILTSGAWAAASEDSWITLIAPTGGTDNGSLAFMVQPNVTATSRTGHLRVNSQSFTVLQDPPAGVPIGSGGLHFVPVQPCRLVDTRENRGEFGLPALAGGVARSFPIPSASCGIPASAKAYALNVTVVPKGTLGYLTIFPTGQVQPFVSTLNSVDGRIKANAAIVSAGTNGAVSVYATDTTELVVDINGYFVGPLANSQSLAFYPITPSHRRHTKWFGDAGRTDA